MNNIAEVLCRLCFRFKTCSENFQLINENTKEMLDTLLLKINLDISKEPQICNDCAESLKNSVKFKAACLRTESRINTFANLEDVSIVDLNEMYLKDIANKELIDVFENQSLCRFCMKLTLNTSLTLLNKTEENKILIIKDMIKKYIPELNLCTTQEPVICETCVNSHQNHVNFMMKCLSVEENIKNCCEIEGININGQVELNNVLQLTLKQTKHEIGEWNINAVKLEKDCDGNTEVPEAEFNLETLAGTKDILCNTDIKNNEDEIKSDEKTYFVDIDNLDLYIKKEENEIKTEGNDFESVPSMPHSENQEPSDADDDNNYTVCVNKVSAKVTKLKCRRCKYETKNEGHFRRHKLSHKSSSALTLYQCDLCPYKTKYKSSVNQHKLIHKPLTDITIHKCETCSFETKYKGSFFRHVLTHKSSDVKRFKCELCPYKAYYRSSLNEHMLVHKDSSETTIYQCELCPYKTKYKSSLLHRHMLIHKNPLEITHYNCDVCAYVTKYKKDLKSHMLTHKSASEVTMFKCEICQHETKHKNALHKHMLVHRDPSETTIYRCEVCRYVAKWKRNLTQHMSLMHKDASEITMHMCEECGYETKYKNNLKSHMLTHKNPSEITMYKCEICPYETKHKNNIKQHAIIHKNQSEMIMYKCDVCMYETKRKGNLTIHMRIHRK